MKKRPNVYLSNSVIILLYWLIIFTLYFPARNAGFVSDFTGWLRSITQDSFYNYVNRTEFRIKSLYQVTQFNTYVLYHLFGTSRLAWHVFFVSFHAVNCLLLYSFIRALLNAAAINNAQRTAFFCGLLYAVCPYVSEVVVWEPSFHYLQAVCFILLILRCTQLYILWQRTAYVAAALVLYFISTFTHELFYLTPWFVLGLALCYRCILNYDKVVFVKILKVQFVPMLLIFGLHLVIFMTIYGRRISHVGTGLLDNPWQSYAIKIPFYAFHLSVLGRMWQEAPKQEVYTLLRTPAGALAVYGVLALLTVWPLLRFKKLSVYNKLIYCLWAGLILSVLIYVPMWIPDNHIVTGDRYTYLMHVFWIPIVVMLVGKINNQRAQRVAFALIACIYVAVTFHVNLRWKQAADIVSSIEGQLKPTPGNIGLMLSIPTSLDGIPLLGASPDGEVRLMHNLLFAPGLKDSLLDVASYNMLDVKDGTHVNIMDDSTIRIFINRPEAEWCRNYVVELFSYETAFYRMHPHPGNNSYDVILKRPLSDFVLYYQVGDRLKIANPALKNVDQY
ncbi:hypothetical protein ACTHGU_15580 [Chitinophagaceae bacterium MMS25-I14]